MKLTMKLIFQWIKLSNYFYKNSNNNAFFRACWNPFLVLVLTLLVPRQLWLFTLTLLVPRNTMPDNMNLEKNKETITRLWSQLKRKGDGKCYCPYKNCKGLKNRRLLMRDIVGNMVTLIGENFFVHWWMWILK